jgi:hypothetical protein
MRTDLDYDPNDEEAVFRYLDSGFAELVERMGNLDSFSVGDAVQVQFEEKLRKDHHIGQFGRMTLNHGAQVFHAGPISVDTTLRYAMTYKGHMDEAEKWAQNEQVTFEFPDVYEPPPIIKPVYPTTLHKVESSVLQVAHQLTNSLHLVSPSEGTLWRTEFIECSVSAQPSRKEEICNILKKINKNVTIQDEGYPSELHYLGSNGPFDEFLPAKWFALVPNPFQAKFPYEPYTLSMSDQGIAVSYIRNGLRQEFFLHRTPDYHLIPPHALAAKFSIVTDSFFLATNYKPLAQFFSIESVRNAPVAGYISYKVDRIPPYDDEGVCSDDEFVYDVIGPGTFLSRYWLICFMAQRYGRRPVVIGNTPTDYVVTYYDKSIVEATNVVVRENVTSYIGPFIIGQVTSCARPRFNIENLTDEEISMDSSWKEFESTLVWAADDIEYKRQFRKRKKQWFALVYKSSGFNYWQLRNCVVYGPHMENGTRFRDFIGNYVVLPCVYHSNNVQIAIPPHLKRPLYVFRNFRHMVMSQFDISERLLGRGLQPTSRYGDLGRTQKIPTPTLYQKMAVIVDECPLMDDAGHLGISDIEMAHKLGISVAQAESLMVTHTSLIYLGQWRRHGKTGGYWIRDTRYTEVRSARYVTEYLLDWRLQQWVIVDQLHSEFFQGFFIIKELLYLRFAPILFLLLEIQES